MGEPKIAHATMARQAGEWVRRAQYELDTVHFIKATIDEAALLFQNESELGAFVAWAKGQGYEHFGSIERDAMLERHGGTRTHAFDVRFEFLRLEGFDFRIEAMCVLDGSAPLHEQALEKYGNGSVIHVSWRAAPNGDADGYHRHRRIVEGSGFAPLLEYDNSYGRFCYYGEDGVPPYFKPRVNLRDV